MTEFDIASIDWASIDWRALIILIILFAAAGFIVRKDNDGYAAFKALTDSNDRRRILRGWILRSFTVFLLGSLGALFLLGRTETLLTIPPEFEAARSIAERRYGQDGPLISTNFLLGMLISLTLIYGSIAIFTRVFVAPEKRKAPGLGDIDALRPRNRREIIETSILAINAGVSEELFFRLVVPLLLTIIIGDALIAFAISIIFFGVMHYYQGIIGVLMTTIAGAALAAIYLASGSLWIPIIVHVLIDLNGLIIMPFVFGVTHRERLENN